MRLLVAFAVCFLLAHPDVYSQEDYTFSTQTDVDIFPLFCDPCDTVGRLTIRNESRFISNLDSLRQITVAAEGLLFSGDINAIDVSGLFNISTIRGGWFYDFFCTLDTLTSWPGLSNLADCEIRTFDRARVRYILGFEGIDSLRSIVLDSDVLQEVDAFPDLKYLGRLRTYSGSVRQIEMSDQITTLNQFWVSNCASLRHVSFLPQLDSIGRLQIDNTPLLNDDFLAMRLSKLSSLELDNQAGMVNLDWLSTLDRLDRLSIIDMPDLLSIEAIDVPIGAVETVDLRNNPALVACQSEWLCHLLRDSIDAVTISDNGPGCNSPEEVLAQCVFSSTSDVQAVEDLGAYPNPTSGRLTLTTACTSCSYEVVDQAGRVVRQNVYQDNVIDLLDLPASTYQVLLYDQKGDLAGRSSIVKQ